MSRSRQASLIAALVVLSITLATKADYRDSSKATKVSGGEDHTLVLTNDKSPWACGPNGGYDYDEYQYYWGLLGTGVSSPSFYEISLVRVRDGMMNTESDYLEDITDISGGWKHSLALDVNGFVWSWGFNSQGQLGIGNDDPRTTPVEVLRGEQPDDPCQPSAYLKHIIGISAGRSGEHSLAADANGYAYAWGRNTQGQLGIGSL